MEALRTFQNCYASCAQSVAGVQEEAVGGAEHGQGLCPASGQCIVALCGQSWLGHLLSCFFFVLSVAPCPTRTCVLMNLNSPGPCSVSRTIGSQDFP